MWHTLGIQAKKPIWEDDILGGCVIPQSPGLALPRPAADDPRQPQCVRTRRWSGRGPLAPSLEPSQDPPVGGRRNRQRRGGHHHRGWGHNTAKLKHGANALEYNTNAESIQDKIRLHNRKVGSVKITRNSVCCDISDSDFSIQSSIAKHGH